MENKNVAESWNVGAVEWSGVEWISTLLGDELRICVNGMARQPHAIIPLPLCATLRQEMGRRPYISKKPHTHSLSIVSRSSKSWLASCSLYYHHQNHLDHCQTPHTPSTSSHPHPVPTSACSYQAHAASPHHSPSPSPPL